MRTMLAGLAQLVRELLTERSIMVSHLQKSLGARTSIEKPAEMRILHWRVVAFGDLGQKQRPPLPFSTAYAYLRISS